jgi:hypothetical protein
MMLDKGSGKLGTHRLGLLSLRKACVGKLALPQLAFSVGDHLSWNGDVCRVFPW